MFCVRVRKRPFVFVDLCGVSTQCRARSSWYSVLSLPNSSKSREVGNISSPLTSGVHSLEMSDFDVVVEPLNFMFGSFWPVALETPFA